MIEPVVIGVEICLPAEIVLAALLGQQVLRLEPHLDREPSRAFPDQHHVVGVIHDRLGHERWSRDVLERRDRSGALRRTMHNARVELHDAVCVGQSAEADGHVVGVELLDVHAGNDRVQRIGTGTQHVVGDFDAPDPVGGSNDDRPSSSGASR
jgi:hypothetical protein